MGYTLITKSTAIEQGWTEGLIKKFLGEPDELKTNPNYKSGPPMRLYNIERIAETAARPEVATALAKVAAQRTNRKAGANKATESKRERLMEWVEGLEIEIPKMSFERLVTGAIAHYNDRQFDYCDSDRSASIESSTEFLQRITENYVRHELTDYEFQLSQLFGQTGKDLAYQRIKTRIMQHFHRAYPHLWGEIDRNREAWVENEKTRNAEAKARKKQARIDRETKRQLAA